VISRAPSFEEGFQAIATIASVAGWGGWEIVSLDREKREARFRSRSSWEGLYQKRLGVCWGSSMIAGKFAGMASRLFGVNCWSEQTAFIARGDEADEFLVRPSDRTVEGELERLLESDAATRADLAVALRKLMCEVEERRAAEEALRKSEQEKLELIARQQQTIVTMATPIIQVWKGVLTLPIVGALDAARAADVMEQLLERIVATSAQAAIIDLTGVDSVDESTADHLLRIVRAIQLLGARAVITGIRPAVAQSIVALGVDLAALTPMANLEEGLKACWRWMAPAPGARPPGSVP
jgi:rsbT co-antagonist protein RsbR